jgi:succinylglutamate desuccinylase
MTAPDATAAAQWMADQIAKHGELWQNDAADHIHYKLNHELTYENENGNLAIGKDVLAAFRKLTEGTVVWERGSRSWRRKGKGDPDGRLAY